MSSTTAAAVECAESPLKRSAVCPVQISKSLAKRSSPSAVPSHHLEGSKVKSVPLSSSSSSRKSISGMGNNKVKVASSPVLIGHSTNLRRSEVTSSPSGSPRHRISTSCAKRTRPAVPKVNRQTVSSTPAPSPSESTNHVQDHFSSLWNVKTIEHGMVRIPTSMLQNLINMERIEKFYDLELKPVASGLFSTVRKCIRRETGITYAAKFSSRVRYGVDCSTEILHEIAMLSVCNDSNNIVHLKEVFQTKDEIILVLEYAPGGDLQSVLDEDMVPFEQDVQGFLKQILEAIVFIHDKNIAHLDIKPQNIVLMGQFPNCEIKLCDLEVARVIEDDEKIKEIIGTPDYVAPEILSLDQIRLSADIWSLGVLTYVLLTGFSPFGGDTDQETLRNISTAKLDFPFELFEGVSDLAKEFISKCLDRNPSNRLTVHECLQHPWLAESGDLPSPSPLMLKIPTADNFVATNLLTVPVVANHPSITDRATKLHDIRGPSHRRSCQTCRDRTTEQKRYLSKSREAIFEKVSQSNLKKSLSKSRERLCDIRMTLGKSKEALNDRKSGFKNSVKEIVKESDLGKTDNDTDFVLLPGNGESSSLLLSHGDLMKISLTPATDDNNIVEEPQQREQNKMMNSVGIQVDFRTPEAFSSMVQEELNKEVKVVVPGLACKKSDIQNDANKKRSWKSEVEKFQLQSRVSQLIDTFDQSPSDTKEEEEEGGTFNRCGSLRIIRNNSHAINIRTKPEIAKLRRRSTSALFMIPGSEKSDFSQPKADAGKKKKKKKNDSSASSRKWDYFEIDHPKAISDKKLLQLQKKYQRRNSTITEEDRDGNCKEKSDQLLDEHNSHDDGIGSLPHSPGTERRKQSSESDATLRLTDDGICTSSSEEALLSCPSTATACASSAVIIASRELPTVAS